MRFAYCIVQFQERRLAFRERCAREQEAYFAIGELTQEPAAGREERTSRGFYERSLVEALHGSYFRSRVPTESMSADEVVVANAVCSCRIVSVFLPPR